MSDDVKPVAWMWSAVLGDRSAPDNGIMLTTYKPHNTDATPLYTRPPDLQAVAELIEAWNRWYHSQSRKDEERCPCAVS